MIQYDDISGMKYRVTKGFQFNLPFSLKEPVDWQFLTVNIKGLAKVKPGHCSDGATGARDKYIIPAAWKHDIACNLYNAGLITKEQRKMADKAFQKNLDKNKNVSEFRADYLYGAVRKFFEAKEWLKKIF